MQLIRLGPGPLEVSRLAYGCWRIAPAGDAREAGEITRRAVTAALEAGYNLFDLADIYCDGRSETGFGEVLRSLPGARAQITIATKCGIRPADDAASGAPYRYDLSADYIVRSCELSLERMGIETIDVFQLHRPDWLLDAAEVAGAFARLRKAGKARYFGVSNFLPSQVELLQAACDEPLLVNQVEISLLQRSAFTNGTLDQCQARRITPLAWSPLGAGLLGDGAKSLLPGQKGYRAEAVNLELDRLAEAHSTTRTAIALAWLLRHPAGIVPIVGSTDPDRIHAATAATRIELSREEWYRLLEAAQGERLP